MWFDLYCPSKDFIVIQISTKSSFFFFFFLMFKNLFKRFYQIEYGLTHIVFSMILSKFL